VGRWATTQGLFIGGARRQVQRAGRLRKLPLSRLPRIRRAVGASAPTV